MVSRKQKQPENNTPDHSSEAKPVVPWRIVYSRQAQKDAQKLAVAGLKPKAKALLEVLAADPFTNPPQFEKLLGDLSGCYSRRINIQHRLVYEVFPAQHTIHVLRMWTHYE
nr:Txe/YoeB family addiction module toxin [Mobiluncus mulieris]